MKKRTDKLYGTETMTTNKNTKSQKIWGGRFTTHPNDVMQSINSSIEVDRRIGAEDIQGSKAHAEMLVRTKIITPEEGKAISTGLDIMATEIDKGTFPFDKSLEDIHMNIEARLKDLIGEPASKLHTARSRNDQVVTDFRMWIRNALEQTDIGLSKLQSTLVRRARDHNESIMPGFTHLQTAQPVTLGHHLLAYVEMLERDRSRLKDASKRLNESPLGAAALAGTGFTIDRDATANTLGFSKPMRNSLDAVSARDFALEVLADLTIAITHLSRLAEEIVLWTSPQFGFATLSDEWSTGSSIMPQKRNPDAAELIRAKASTLAGHFVSLQGAIKALPLAYAKDLQDDKHLTFSAFDTFELCLQAMTGMIDTMAFNIDTMYQAAKKGYSTATDLADWLVRELGLPFRQAHHITGKIVAEAEKRGIDLVDLPLDVLQKFESRISQDIFSVLSIAASVASRASYGGTSPQRVMEQVKFWETRLGI